MTITVINIVAGPFVGTGLQQTIPYLYKVFTPSEVEVVTGVGDTQVAVDPSLYTVTRNMELDGQVKEGGSITIQAGAVAAGTSIRAIAKPKMTQDQTYSDTSSRLKNLNEGLDRATLRALRAQYDGALEGAGAELLDAAREAGLEGGLAASADKLQRNGLNKDANLLVNIGASPRNFANTVYDGSVQRINATGTQPGGSIRGRNILAVDNSIGTGYGAERTVYTKVGLCTDNGNDIGRAFIGRWDNMTGAFAWVDWSVAQSPLFPGSGLPTAPTDTQTFFVLNEEINPQNRHSQVDTFRAETRAYPRLTLSSQKVPETQDFTGLLGKNRFGFNIISSDVVAKSPYTDTVLGRHAQTVVPRFILPNAVAHIGYGSFATGHRPFVVGVTLVNAGTGYAVDNDLRSNTGLDPYQNEEFTIRVRSVDGAGRILGFELLTAGSFQGAVTNPVPMTFGSGTGATFSVVLSQRADEQPVAHTGIAGQWEAGINGLNLEAGFASFTKGVLYMPTGTVFATARRASDNVDIPVLAYSMNERVQLNGRDYTVPVDYTPIISAEAGTLGSLSGVSGRWWLTNGVLNYEISFQIVSVGSGTQALRATLPAGFSPLVVTNAIASIVSTSVPLVGYVAVGSTYVRAANAAGTIAVGAYLISGSVEV